MDSNEDIKKTIDETAKRHTQLELLKKVRVYETKRMDIDAVKENTFRRKYEYDEDYEYYVCTQDLDQDEMYRFITGQFRECPYYRAGDEYSIVRKQM